MQIKLVTNDDFDSLLALVVKMYAEIDPRINYFQATNTLVTMVNNGTNFTAIGLYKEEDLKGFVIGFDVSEEVFNFAGIYLEDKSTEDTKELIEYSFKLVKERGYKFWEASVTNENIKSILEKYGAKPITTKYRKEI